MTLLRSHHLPVRHPLHGLVARLYQRYPYPKYPLLAKPLWESGYTLASTFIRRLADKTPLPDQKESQILLLGCGEILPYVARRWEGRRTLCCVDLSKQSLRRGQIRLWRYPGKQRWNQEDIDIFLERAANQGQIFHHIDCYGVLHHLADPSQTLKKITRVLAPSGTMRLMVYNSRARQWIHRIQKVLRLLDLSAERAADVDFAKSLVKALGRYHPYFSYYLTREFVRATVTPSVRFVDTFLHPRETRIPFGRWLAHLDAAQLKPFALFDRYGELDDLVNPLWQFPKQTELQARIDDLRYENNFEWYLIPELKKDNFSTSKERLNTPDVWRYAPSHLNDKSGKNLTTRLQSLNPPSSWFNFSETRSLSSTSKKSLWRLFTAQLNGQNISQSDLPDFKMVPLAALKRLARLGVLFPNLIEDEALKRALFEPLYPNMEAPKLPDELQTSFDEIDALLMKRSKLSEDLGRRALTKQILVKRLLFLLD